MKMGIVEKALVNRPRKAAANSARVRRHLEALLPWQGTHALELGAGIGDVAASLVLERGYRAIATDLDEDQVEIARRRHSAVSGLGFSVEDASSLTFPDEMFDLVVSQNVFHHIPAWPDAVREVARVLRPGGHLLWLDLAVPRQVKPLLRPFRGRAGVYTATEIREAFAEVGLTEVHHRHVFHGLTTHHDLILGKPLSSGAA